MPGRFIGVHHSLVGGVFAAQVATSDDLRHWTHRGTLDTHGSFALGNRTVRAFSDADGVTTLLVSGFVFGEGAGPGEAGQFIALRRLDGLV